MPYDITLADRIRDHLVAIPKIRIEEKEMFRGLTFMVNGKMCVCVSGDNMMCRFDPDLTESLTERIGYLPMKMKNKVYKGFCYVAPEGFKAKKDFEFWIALCLAFNTKAKASKKSTAAKKKPAKKTAAKKKAKR